VVATAVVAVLLLPGGPVRAVINAALQPVDLFQRYQLVVVGEVGKIDPAAATFEVRVTRSYKGEHGPGARITVAAEGAMKGELSSSAKSGAFAAGAPFVGFAGKRRPRRHRNDFLFYTTTGFGVGSMESPARWRWEATDKQEVGIELGGEKAEPVGTLGGTWNGSVGKLMELLDDISRDRAFFPRKAYCRFKPDMLLDELEGPVRGVALYDINGDDRLDICACSDLGNRIYFQFEHEEVGMAFAPVEGYLRVEDVTSPSCSFADVNGDGLTDYLAGGALFMAALDGDDVYFDYSELLPPEADEGLKSSAFVEVNGDGRPDVVVSKEKGGLRLYLNPGAAGGKFRDATGEAGLDAEECGAGLDGYFCPGDWNDDGRTDLFYAAGPGLILVQDEGGRFSPVEHDVYFLFESGEERTIGLTGAGCFAPFIEPGRLDLMIPHEKGWTLVANVGGVPTDVTGYGGEITEGSYLHLATTAADLNVDGYVDYYTTSRDENGHNRFIINRGYGSFMHSLPHRYYGYMFEGPASTHGGWGVAAGDVNDDGADDVLLGNLHGHLVLQLSETLELRKPVEHPIDDIERLLEVRVLTVRVKGALGVLGARVLLSDEGGAVVGRRDIGSNVAVGCRGPDTVNLAVRGSGAYVVAVRFSDGRTEAWDVDLTGKERVVLVAERGTGRPPSAGPQEAEADAPAGDEEGAVEDLFRELEKELEAVGGEAAGAPGEPPGEGPPAPGQGAGPLVPIVVVAAGALLLIAAGVAIAVALARGRRGG
jgi:hypothetical protein